MKYSILGFYQAGLVQSGLKAKKIDIIDLHLLEWFSDWAKDNTMITKTIVDKDNDTERTFFWINYESVAAEFPFFAQSPESIRKRFTKMVNAGLLRRKTVRGKDNYRDINGKRRTRKVMGTLTYFAIEPLYFNLRSATHVKNNSRNGAE